MHRLGPVVWAKGTVLNPQQLQMQDRFIEHSIRFLAETLHFRPWGFARIRLDQEALAAGSIALGEAAGIMPDGLLFDMPSPDAAPEARPLDPALEAVDVFLAVPQYRAGACNVARAGRQGDARYRAEVEPVRDENDGASEKPVLVARKNFRLLFEGESREGVTAMRVARLERTPAGLFQPAPRFAPPLVDFHASEYLTSIARRLVEILSARSGALGDMRRQKNQSLADFTAADIPNFWLLYTVNSLLPGFRHLFENRGQHPETLFSRMLSMAGALTTFSRTIQPCDLPAYDHEDLGACFTVLDEQLRGLLETVVPRNFVSLPLRMVQTAIYAAAIDREEYLAAPRMYLALRAEAPRAEIIGRAPQLLKVSSADRIDNLVRLALPGVQLTHVASPPAAVPVKLDYEYFALNQSGPAWEAICRARNFAAYVPGDFANPQLELIVVLPRSA